MIDEKEARNEGKRVRPEGTREGGRRLMDSRPAETSGEDETLEEFEDVLKTFAPDEEDELEEEEALFWDLPEEEAEPEEELPDPAPAAESGRRVRVREEGQGEEPPKSGLWSRAVDACTDLAGRVLDWTDELSERFDEMASDPENDSLVAQVIRGSEDIVEGLEEQQRETDAEIDEEARMRAAREQHKREVPPQPKLVFYTADNPDTPVDLRDLARDRGKQGKQSREKAGQPKRAASRPQEGEAPAREAGITRDALIDQFSDQPEPEKPEQPAQPPRKRSAAPRREAEPAQGKSAAPRREAEPARRKSAAPRREAEQPVREKPVKPPIPKEERQQVIRLTRKLQYWLFILVLGFFGILGILGPLRADSTEVEDRPLTEKPAISVAGLWNGDYFGRLEQWYSDTYPLRDRLAGEYDLLGPIGFGPVTLKQDAAKNPDQEGTEESVPAGTQSPETGTPSPSPAASE